MKNNFIDDPWRIKHIILNVGGGGEGQKKKHHPKI